MLLLIANTALFAQNNLSVEVTGLVPDKGNVILDYTTGKLVSLIMDPESPM
ncbi:hypothetical protein [Flavobacterium sp. HJSW_4]|uniref:hypothetical protein n=1 Tax=Flavobacterium sp. HJSW_4 TaxID=3344660 RepID=UPI0035F3222E